jgi:GxxExxY protein
MENKLAKQVVDAAYRVHLELGPGLLEGVYEAALAAELGSRGLRVARQVPVEVRYRGTPLAEGFRMDLLVEDRVVVELKSVEVLAPIHGKQLLTYLRLGGYHLGLLVNFGAPTFREGVRRVVCGLPDAGG